MKLLLRIRRLPLRLARASLLLAGILALLLLAAQFTPLPWRAYDALSRIPDPSPAPPSLILVFGGSGVPGKSALMRTFYAAQAARQHPLAPLLVAMPLDASSSASSRAYLDELLLRGVPESRVLILPGGRNTREQALRLAEHLGPRARSDTLLVVTDPEHIRRAAACLRHVGISRLIPCPTSPVSIEDSLLWQAASLDSSPPPAAAAVPDVGSSLLLRYTFWTNLNYSIDAARERAALLYYRLRGWI